MHEGRITQFGPTGEIYRNPVDKLTAGVFSDPPINTIRVSKKNNRFTLSGGTTWKARGAYGNLSDGVYEFGVRPHHVRPVSDGSDGAIVEGTVQVAEISGSESMVHFDLQGESWVSLAHGVHRFDVGQTACFQIDVDHSMVFSTQGDLVATMGG
jgi:glycerol transport system ATP-binding protein